MPHLEKKIMCLTLSSQNHNFVTDMCSAQKIIIWYKVNWTKLPARFHKSRAFVALASLLSWPAQQKVWDTQSPASILAESRLENCNKKCVDFVMKMYWRCTFFLAPVPHYCVPHYRASQTSPNEGQSQLAFVLSTDEKPLLWSHSSILSMSLPHG